MASVFQARGDFTPMGDQVLPSIEPVEDPSTPRVHGDGPMDLRHLLLLESYRVKSGELVISNYHGTSEGLHLTAEKTVSSPLEDVILIICSPKSTSVARIMMKWTLDKIEQACKQIRAEVEVHDLRDVADLYILTPKLSGVEEKTGFVVRYYETWVRICNNNLQYLYEKEFDPRRPLCQFYIKGRGGDGLGSTTPEDYRPSIMFLDDKMQVLEPENQNPDAKYEHSPSYGALPSPPRPMAPDP